MLTLYPAIRPYKEHSLKVDRTHTLHVEECGNASGVPILFLHGGPGGGCIADHRRFFNPDVYRIILFDQRGCGRSTPHAELTDNTTDHLIVDIEKIREELNITQWHVFGGSWGSTLALLYACRYPKNILGMILRGIFLGRKQDYKWLYHDGACRIYPDYWEDFLSVLPASKRKDVVTSYYEILTGDDEITRMAAAKAWSLWESRCSTLEPSPKLEKAYTEPRIALSMAKIEAHYFVNKLFIKKAILADIDKIKDIPGVIVHGRFDMVCTLDNAYELHKAWPNSKLRIIRDAGHSAAEPGITHELIHATNAISM